jgi:hypothetical protein
VFYVGAAQTGSPFDAWHTCWQVFLNETFLGRVRVDNTADRTGARWRLSRRPLVNGRQRNKCEGSALSDGFGEAVHDRDLSMRNSMVAKSEFSTTNQKRHSRGSRALPTIMHGDVPHQSRATRQSDTLIRSGVQSGSSVVSYAPWASSAVPFNGDYTTLANPG